MTPDTRVPPGRLLSVDLLPGVTIGFMILVNDPSQPADAYAPVRDAAWNGFTPTELSLSNICISCRYIHGLFYCKATAERCNRSFTLFACSRPLNYPLPAVPGSQQLTPFLPFYEALLRSADEGYGVLLDCCTLYLLSRGRRSKVAVLIAILGGYWILMRFVPVPGCGGPGRRIPFLNPNANLAAWLDRHILLRAHLFEGTRAPEGLLSALPAAGTALIGLLTGIWLRTSRPLSEIPRSTLIAGVSGVALGYIWNCSFPINKQLRTSSYVHFADALRLLLLALFMWVPDLRISQSTKSGKNCAHTGLLVFGTNAIFAYVLSEVLNKCLWTICSRSGLNLTQWPYEGTSRVVPDAHWPRRSIAHHTKRSAG